MEEKKIMIFKGTIDKELVGFVDIEFLGEQSSRINGITIIEEFRGKGFAKELLKYALAFLQKTGNTEIFLLVREDNEIAKKIYSAFNFRFEEYLDKKIVGKKIEKWYLRSNTDFPSYYHMNIIGVWVW